MPEKGYHIREIRINGMKKPMGVDFKQPVFSWILESEENGIEQKEARIRVGSSAGTDDFWDSGWMKTDCSLGIPYGGKELLPETRYYVKVSVRDRKNRNEECESWFETGLMNPYLRAWGGARWIGAPEYVLAADTMTVFVIESTIAIKKGSRAGIVFGAADPRLLDKYKNEMLLEGENFIRFVINTEVFPAAMEIWRVGYSPSDRADHPLAVFPVKDIRTGRNLITKENQALPHRVRIEVTGNCARTYVDGFQIDGEVRDAETLIREPRVLNPLGGRDVTSFPRLNSIGYYAGEETEVIFSEGIRVFNLRHPGNEIAAQNPEGIILKGECQMVKDPSAHSLPMLRSVFEITKEIEKARLYTTARGIYSCRVNGSRISEEYFAPGASQYDHHLMYQTSDVTGFLRPGKNVLGCILSSGWWSDSFSFWLPNYNYWGDKPSFLARLVLVFRDGTREEIVSDPGTWEYYGEGPWRYAGFFNGEQYDARKEVLCEEFFREGKDMAGIDKPMEIRPVPIRGEAPMFPGASEWPDLNMREPELVGHYQAPVREIWRVAARSVSEPRKGVYIYDLGQEIAGVPRIRLHEKAGTKVVVRYGEFLYPEMERYKGLNGLMLQANLREASNTDIYICSGSEEEFFQPEFTFHGYRYIEITGVSNPPAPDEVQGILISSVEQISGEFRCSNDLVNRFVKNVRFSQYSNFISIPTDCPQRNERMGWLGDTHVFCHTALLLSAVKNFYLRNLQAIRDLQTEEGRLPSIAPFGGGFGGQTYESGMILMVWELYQFDGDLSVIEEYFPAMDKWMDAIGRAGLPGQPVLKFIEWLGDWLAPDETDPSLIFNAFHFRNAVLMKRFAELTGRAEAGEKYERIAEDTKSYWNSIFMDSKTGRTLNADGSASDTQGSYAIALNTGVVREEFREDAFRHLDEKTREGNYTIRTGFFGTGPLNYMLSAGGYTETAARTITETAYPSWLYPVTEGATTVWERWNSFTAEEGFGENNSMNSFDHYSLGSAAGWLYEHVLGIQRDEDRPGYKHFFLRPECEAFDFAKGGIDTPHGRIESEWKKKDCEILYRCLIPANTTADLVLGGTVTLLKSGEYRFAVKDARIS